VVGEMVVVVEEAGGRPSSISRPSYGGRPRKTPEGRADVEGGQKRADGTPSVAPRSRAAQSRARSGRPPWRADGPCQRLSACSTRRLQRKHAPSCSVVCNSLARYVDQALLGLEHIDGQTPLHKVSSYTRNLRLPSLLLAGTNPALEEGSSG
jgi:hypothetical protein